MTVLWETGDCPPRKRLCLSTNQSRRGVASSQEVHAPSPKRQPQQMAMPIEPGQYCMHLQ